MTTPELPGEPEPLAPPPRPTPGDELLTAIVEGILFAADKPLTADEVRGAVDHPGVTQAAVSRALGRLLERHRDAPDRGFRLVSLGERWQFRTTARVTEQVAAFTGLRPVKLSRAALETLAIVAYKQPCTRSDVERVRGVDTGGVLRALLDRKLLRIAGRRDEPGRPIVYATAQDFLDSFGLGSLADLPSLREFTQLGEEDLEAAEELLEGARRQVTFEEYAQRQVLGTLDEAVEQRLGTSEHQPGVSAPHDGATTAPVDGPPDPTEIP
jgi:segregation and condensation protein B